MEAQRAHVRWAVVAVGALLAASVLVLLFRFALFTGEVWAWVYVALDVMAILLAGFAFWQVSREPGRLGERGRARRAPGRTGPSPAVQGVYGLAGLGVIGALAEFGDQLLG